jgi:hypothetical protein
MKCSREHVIPFNNQSNRQRKPIYPFIGLETGYPNGKLEQKFGLLWAVESCAGASNGKNPLGRTFDRAVHFNQSCEAFNTKLQPTILGLAESAWA